MRKRKYGLLLAAAALALCGCAKTPEKAIVRAKSGQSAKDYQEETNTLIRELQAPEHYTASVALENTAFSVDCDAEVQIPDATKVPVCQVTQRAFTQEWIDRVTETFFGEAPVYEEDYLYKKSRSEILERLDELKQYQATGAESPERMNDIQYEIDALEQEYAGAPQTVEKVRAKPELASNGASSGASFMGLVQMEDGTAYTYHLKQWTAMPMEIEIRKIDPDVSASLAIQYSKYGVPDELAGKQYGCTPDEEAGQQKAQEDAAGITRQEAVARADEYIEKLGLSQEFSCKSVRLAAGTYPAGEFGEDGGSVITDYGWKVNYTRDIENVPVTDDGDMGGGLESMESTIVPWCYENVSITVGKDGLLAAHIANLYDVGEQSVENVRLLPFSEIAGIFEQMMPIQNADITGWNWMKVHIYKVTFGYMRIYDPNVDNRTGTMVPVWDFYGVQEGELEYDGSVCRDETDNSFLTVNAADGTVIDRSLGY